MKEFKFAAYRSPFFISSIYLFMSALWITFSDQWVLAYVDDPVQITAIQTYKGWFFISVSAILIFILVLSSNKNFIKLFNRYITTLKNFNNKLEAQVEERTLQLKQANEELESFSYSVSHDLRSPLRAISGYTGMLNENYKDKLDESGNNFLDIIRSEVKRMDVLIDDLLAFSRLNRTGLKLVDFNMKELVEKSVSDLVHAYPDLDFEIDLEELHDTSGDPNLLKQVWTNLIDNAFKYHKKEEKPVIIIGSTLEEKSNEIRYFVRDKGVGFDMKYADKLFGVFQRLHSKDEFEGTGIGLATVKRIISRHNGTVWAESEKDQGSTFYFTLPLHTDH